MSRVGLKPLRVLHIVRHHKKGFPSSQCFRETALDDLMFMECDEGTSQILICADNAFIHHKSAVFYARPFFQSALLPVNHVRNLGYRHESELVET